MAAATAKVSSRTRVDRRTARIARLLLYERLDASVFLEELVNTISLPTTSLAAIKARRPMDVNRG
jgi:hypothetical protein